MTRSKNSVGKRSCLTRTQVEEIRRDYLLMQPLAVARKWHLSREWVWEIATKNKPLRCKDE